MFRCVLFREKQEIIRGLSQHLGLPMNTIALFVLPAMEHQNFTTAEMHFDIDIFFFDSSCRLVDRVFQTPSKGAINARSSRPARFVIEAEAGFCAKHRIGEIKAIYLPRSLKRSISPHFIKSVLNPH